MRHGAVVGVADSTRESEPQRALKRVLSVNANEKLVDSPELDDFFRRGDPSTQGTDSLQPIGDFGDEEPLGDVLRTPAQIERRAKFVRLVSVAMACMTLGSIGAFSYKAIQVREKERISAADSMAPGLARSLSPQESQQSRQAQPLQRSEATGEASELSIESTPEIAAPVEPLEVPPAMPSTHPPEPDSTLAKGGAPTPSTRGAAASRQSPVPIRTAPATRSVAVRAAKPAIATVTSATSPVVNAEIKAVPIADVSSAAAAARRSSQAVPARTKSGKTSTASAKPVGPRPDDYHPPTASFSD